ncbi:MAG: SOS response-associated peptidase [Chloroflexi bacterium]|nr:SOS response-associated peptidase [Chloroflexota bacterium]
MCGRYALYSSSAEIEEAFNVKRVTFNFAPGYNIAPSQELAVVVQREGQNVLQQMRWGLVPPWAKDMSIGSKLINARSETLIAKPMFKRPFKSQRCMVVANGFFEWQQTGRAKIPMFIRLRSRSLFGFAGLYDFWTSPQAQTITSCTIITTYASEFIRPIHNRMPVILHKEQESAWLDLRTCSVEELIAMLGPYPAEEMEAYEVSSLVNSPKSNLAECIEPLSE